MSLKLVTLFVCALAVYATTEQGDAEAAKLVDEIVRLLPDVEAEPSKFFLRIDSYIKCYKTGLATFAATENQTMGNLSQN